MIERSPGQKATLLGEKNEWFQVARARVKGRMVHREMVIREEDRDPREGGSTMAFIFTGGHLKVLRKDNYSIRSVFWVWGS